MAERIRCPKVFLPAAARALTALALACGSNSPKGEPVHATQASGAGGLAMEGNEAAQGGRSGTGSAGSGSETVRGGQANLGTAGDRGAAGHTATNGSLTPPCSPDDNTLTISTGDILTDLPSQMMFTVFDSPTSKDFTGNGSNGDIRVHLPKPAQMDRVFPTATVVDPLDRESVNIELVLASGFLNARYVVETGAQVYAQTTADRVVLTFCEVKFGSANDPPDSSVITVSGRVVATSR
jgi:hypothetical protein